MISPSLAEAVLKALNAIDETIDRCERWGKSHEELSAAADALRAALDAQSLMKDTRLSGCAGLTDTSAQERARAAVEALPSHLLDRANTEAIVQALTPDFAAALTEAKRQENSATYAASRVSQNG